MSDPTLIAALPDTLQVLPNRRESASLTNLEEQKLYQAVQELQRNYSLMVQALKAGS